tara:strand:- start:359 stop:805 length:447 start_codon:yes stop_codon:yes gene_type:complete
VDEEEFPLGLAIASMVTTVFFAIMLPTGDDDLFWGGVISLPFYFLFLIRHLYLRGFRKTEASTFLFSFFCSLGLWALQFLAYGDPWYWESNQFIISGILALITPFTICAIAVAQPVSSRQRIPTLSGAIISLPFCMMAMIPAGIFFFE